MHYLALLLLLTFQAIIGIVGGYFLSNYLNMKIKPDTFPESIFILLASIGFVMVLVGFILFAIFL